MAISPLDHSSGPLSISIEINGKLISDTLQVLSIQVHRKVNEVASAQLVLGLDKVSDKSNRNKIMESVPLNGEIKISAGYDNKNTQIFNGLIAQHELKLQGVGPMEIVIHSIDKAIRLTDEPKYRFFQNIEGEDLFSTILKGYPVKKELGDLPFFSFMIQDHITDWEFLKGTASANNCLLYTQDGIVIVKKPQPKLAPLLHLTYGVDVEQFQGKIERPNGSSTSVVTGSIQFQGNALPQINTTVELRDFSNTLDGSVLVNEVQHTLIAGAWKTRLGLGMDVAEESKAKTQPTNTLTQGLVMATVKQISGDPQEEFRVLTTMDNGSQEKVELWAKMAQNQATNGSGTFFYPDIGDEVVLCFPNGDLNSATILGQCYSKNKKPAYSPDETNRYKAIVSRAGLIFEMDEHKKTIQLKTRGGQQILLSDQENKIVLKDSNGNSIELSEGGITIDSAKDLTLKAKRDVILDATAKIDGKAKADINLDGLNIKAKAKVALDASGNTSAKLSAAGQLTIQGAMVMIN